MSHLSTSADLILIGVGGVAVSFFSFAVATKASTASKRLETLQLNYDHAQVDAGAYERARILYESAIAQNRQQVDDLQTEIARLRGQLAETYAALSVLQQATLNRPPPHHPPPVPPDIIKGGTE